MLFCAVQEENYGIRSPLFNKRRGGYQGIVVLIAFQKQRHFSLVLFLPDYAVGKRTAKRAKLAVGVSPASSGGGYGIGTL